MRLRILLSVLALAAIASGFKFAGVKQDLALQRGKIDEEWTRVEAAMQKRADAIPQLIVESGERPDVQLVAERKSLSAAQSPAEKIRANREISLALAKVLLRCETDPVVRTSGGLQRMREGLAAHEDEIANARYQYNNAIEHYNARMQRFPDNVVASLAGFTRNEAYFGTGPDTAPAPK